MISFSSSQLAKTTFAGLLLTMSALSLAGCVTDGINLASKQAVVLPPAPSFLAPVAIPAIKAGDDARVTLAKMKAAAEAANLRLTYTRATYDAMRQRYGGDKLKK